MFLDEKTVLEIWLNPGLNLTIFRGTGPWSLSGLSFADHRLHPTLSLSATSGGWGAFG